MGSGRVLSVWVQDVKPEWIFINELGLCGIFALDYIMRMYIAEVSIVRLTVLLSVWQSSVPVLLSVWQSSVPVTVRLVMTVITERLAVVVAFIAMVVAVQCAWQSSQCWHC